MSRTVRYEGKLDVILKNHNETQEQYYKRCIELLEGHEIRLKNYSWCDSYEELIYDNYYDKLIICNNTVYKVIECIELNPEFDIFKAKVNSEGTIDFEVMYYNGGCGFSEAIEEALNNAKFVK